MKILTDSEIMDINQNAEFDSAIGYARKIESAVLEKLKAQEPVCHINAANVAHLRRGILQSNVRAKRNPEKHTVPLYEHPLPPADVVRDPRVAELEATCVDHGEIQKALCERVAELEVGLRECRESLDAVTKWNAPPDFNGRKIDRIVEKAIAKIDEVLHVKE